MTDRRGTKQEEVYIDLDYCNLEECITHLNNAFNEVPKEGRESAKFLVEYGEEYGSAYTKQKIIYSRPETDVEMNKRIAQQEAWELRKIADAKKLLGIK